MVGDTQTMFLRLRRLDCVRLTFKRNWSYNEIDVLSVDEVYVFVPSSLFETKFSETVDETGHISGVVGSIAIRSCKVRNRIFLIHIRSGSTEGPV